MKRFGDAQAARRCKNPIFTLESCRMGITRFTRWAPPIMASLWQDGCDGCGHGHSASWENMKSTKNWEKARRKLIASIMKAGFLFRYKSNSFPRQWKSWLICFPTNLNVWICFMSLLMRIMHCEWAWGEVEYIQFLKWKGPMKYLLIKDSVSDMRVWYHAESFASGHIH